MLWGWIANGVSLCQIVELNQRYEVDISLSLFIQFHSIFLNSFVHSMYMVLPGQPPFQMELEGFIYSTESLEVLIYNYFL